MFRAAVSVSVGWAPPGGVAASKSLSHAFSIAVTQADSRMPSVFSLANVVVCGPFSGSTMTGPRPPVSRSTRFGTFPAAIRNPNSSPLNAPPSRNCAPVQTEATVVSSLIVTRAGGTAPNVAISMVAGLDPLPAAVLASPPAAMR